LWGEYQKTHPTEKKGRRSLAEGSNPNRPQKEITGKKREKKKGRKSRVKGQKGASSMGAQCLWKYGQKES